MILVFFWYQYQYGTFLSIGIRIKVHTCIGIPLNPGIGICIGISYQFNTTKKVVKVLLTIQRNIEKTQEALPKNKEIYGISYIVDIRVIYQITLRYSI